jgi:hypothetical protein
MGETFSKIDLRFSGSFIMTVGRWVAVVVLFSVDFTSKVVGLLSPVVGEKGGERG